MRIPVSRLTESRDLHEFHFRLRELECAAPEALDLAIREAESKTSEIHQATAAYLSAFKSYWRDPYDAFFRRAKRLARERPSEDLERYLVGRAICLLARSCLRQENLSMLKGLIDDARAQADYLNFPLLRLEADEIDSRHLASVCDWEQAIQAARATVNAYEELVENHGGHDFRGEALAREALGLAYFDSGQFDAAEKEFRTSVRLFEECEDEYGLVDIELLRAHLSYHSNDEPGHERRLRRVFLLCEKISYHRAEATAIRYKGKSLLQQGQWSKAAERFEESYRVFQQAGDPGGMARAHLSLARAYTQGGEWDKAEKNCEHAKDLFMQCEDDKHLGTVFMARGLLSARCEPQKIPNPETLVLFDEAQTVFENINDRRHQASALWEIGQQHLRWTEVRRKEYEELKAKRLGADGGDSVDIEPEITKLRRQNECCTEAFKFMQNAILLASDLHATRLAKSISVKKDEVFSSTLADMVNLALEAKREQRIRFSLLRHNVHCIGNLTAKIATALSVVQESDPDLSGQQTRQCVEIAALGASLLKELCKSILEAERRGQPNKKTIRPREIVEELFKIISPVSGSGGRLENLIDKDLTAEADELHFRRVLFNLLHNADKHTSQNKKIMVSAERQTRGKAGVQEVVFAVADTGEGMPADIRDRVFDIFVTAKSSGVSHESMGYGVGLDYCRWAVEAHGGKIWVDLDETRVTGEDPNRPEYSGTVVRFSLPKS